MKTNFFDWDLANLAAGTFIFVGKNWSQKIIKQ